MVDEERYTKRPVRNAIPTFRSEAEEGTFWETHDTSPFGAGAKTRLAVFPNLKPSTERFRYGYLRYGTPG